MAVDSLDEFLLSKFFCCGVVYFATASLDFDNMMKNLPYIWDKAFHYLCAKPFNPISLAVRTQ